MIVVVHYPKRLRVSKDWPSDVYPHQLRARLLTANQDCSNMPLTEALYGKKAAALYQQAGAFQAEARTFQLKAKDAYFQANNWQWAGYDDMRRARQ